MVVAAFAVVGLSKNQAALYLWMLAAVFLLWTVGCLLGWRFTYLEMIGHFFRNKAATLSKEMLALVKETKPGLERWDFEKDHTNFVAELDRVRGLYANRFSGRLKEFAAEAIRRGLADPRTKDYYSPDILFQIEVTAEWLWSIKRTYRSY
jgi:hypothetical protein